MKGLIYLRLSAMLIALMLSSSSFAAPIQPDRPGFSTGTYTVAPGETHLEMGFQSSFGDHAGEADTTTAPLLNVRVGLNATTELNILMDGWTREQLSAGSVTSTSDILLGVKHRLVSEDKYNLSVLGFISLAMGNSVDSGSFSPFIGLLWDYEISQNISAFGTLQFISLVENSQRSTNFQPAVGLAFSHTDKLSTFIEYYRDISLNASANDADMFDAGIAYLIANNIQLDFNFGYSLDRDSSDFVGAGIAIRF